MSTNHQAHSFAHAAEPRVFEEPPHIKRSIVRPNVQPYKAVRRMTKRPIAKAAVLGEERYPSELVQEGNDVRILGSQACDLASNFSEGNSPCPEKLRLVPGKVFVQQIQAAASAGPLRAIRRVGRSWLA